MQKRHHFGSRNYFKSDLPRPWCVIVSRYDVFLIECGSLLTKYMSLFTCCRALLWSRHVAKTTYTCLSCVCVCVCACGVCRIVLAHENTHALSLFLILACVCGIERFIRVRATHERDQNSIIWIARSIFPIELLSAGDSVYTRETCMKI